MYFPMYWNGTVDDWIYEIFGARSDGTAAGSLSFHAQRFSQSVLMPARPFFVLITHRLPLNKLYNAITAPGTQIVTQQSIIDAYYGLLSTVDEPYPA